MKDPDAISGLFFDDRPRNVSDVNSYISTTLHVKLYYIGYCFLFTFLTTAGKLL